VKFKFPVGKEPSSARSNQHIALCQHIVVHRDQDSKLGCCGRLDKIHLQAPPDHFPLRQQAAPIQVSNLHQFFGIHKEKKSGREIFILFFI